ncbi:MAG TPA: metallophosphoesterase family protein [Nitrososphaera sp.]
MQLEHDSAAADASGIISKMDQAMAVLQSERQNGKIDGGRISGGLVHIAELQNLVVISDLHGDSKSLYRVLSEVKYEKFLSNPMNKMVFLGDYVDRGSDSVGVIYSICHLKCEYPDSVVLMRGNHEAPAEFPFGSHDLPYRVEERFGSSGKKVYRKMLSTFSQLSLATIIEQKLLLVHGGLPTEESTSLQSLAFANENRLKSRTLEELLWNDPRTIDSEPGWEPSRRGFGRHFGSSISRRWLDLSNTKAIVRGHEPCQGFKLDHDDAVMTLFSCTEAYPKFKAAYLLLSSDHLATVRNAMDLTHYVRFLA